MIDVVQSLVTFRVRGNLSKARNTKCLLNLGHLLRDPHGSSAVSLVARRMDTLRTSDRVQILKYIVPNLVYLYTAEFRAK